MSGAPPAAGAPAPVSQHVALWDVHRARGWVALYSEGHSLARIELSDAADFGALVTMLSDPQGAWFDAAREVLRTAPRGPSSPRGDDEAR